MRCPCGGLIKKGVKDRISDIAKWDEPQHPEFRPKYTHILPLAEIISLVHGKRDHYGFMFRKYGKNWYRHLEVK